MSLELTKNDIYNLYIEHLETLAGEKSTPFLAPTIGLITDSLIAWAGKILISQSLPTLFTLAGILSEGSDQIDRNTSIAYKDAYKRIYDLMNKNNYTRVKLSNIFHVKSLNGITYREYFGLPQVTGYKTSSGWISNM